MAEDSLRTFGEYPALHFEGRDYTNLEQHRAACRVAAALRRLGVEPGDRVVVLLPNCPEVMQSYGGILRAGGVIVPIIFLLGDREVAHILAHSEARVVITSVDMLGKVQGQLGALPSLRHVLLVDGDGWLRTGDMGRLDADGFLYVVERKKDLIIRGGLNIYPREVEEVLHAHRKVAEAAVVGMADPLMGEEVRAWVVLREGQTATPAEITAFCAERLARFKCPKDVRITDGLPKSPVGKILRRELRARA